MGTHTHTHGHAHVRTSFECTVHTYYICICYCINLRTCTHNMHMHVQLHLHLQISVFSCISPICFYVSNCVCVRMWNRNVSYHIHPHQTQIRTWNLNGSFFPSGFVAFQSVNIMCGQRGFMAHSSMSMHFLDVFLWEAPVERFAP